MAGKSHVQVGVTGRKPRTWSLSGHRMVGHGQLMSNGTGNWMRRTDSQMACLWQPYPPIKGVYPLVNVYIAMEAMAHRKFVGLPIDSMAIFQFANCKRSPGRVSEKSFAMGIFINHRNICSA